MSPLQHFDNRHTDVKTIVVAVPTPLIANTAQIDTSIIQNALETISDHVRPGATIVVESSVSVGMTRSLLGKMVETHNLHAGMSPEVSSIRFLQRRILTISSEWTQAESTHHTRASPKSFRDSTNNPWKPSRSSTRQSSKTSFQFQARTSLK